MRVVRTRRGVRGRRRVKRRARADSGLTRDFARGHRRARDAPRRHLEDVAPGLAHHPPTHEFDAGHEFVPLDFIVERVRETIVGASSERLVDARTRVGRDDASGVTATLLAVAVRAGLRGAAKHVPVPHRSTRHCRDGAPEGARETQHHAHSALSRLPRDGRCHSPPKTSVDDDRGRTELARRRRTNRSRNARSRRGFRAASARRRRRRARIARRAIPATSHPSRSIRHATAMTRVS